jgi:hypothetical protein
MNAVALPGLASGRYCAPRHGQRLAPVDLALVILFLLGLYLGVSLQITQKIPLTCAPSGFAGLILLWRRRDQIEPTHLAGLFGVVVLYLGSILSATDYSFLDKRFTGLVQLTYSLVISYALFVTLIHGNRDQIAWVLFGFCLAIIIGCLLENYTDLRTISDKVRERLYDSSQVYDADLRDRLLYGGIRPKLFTSEPSAVTFAFTHYCSVWLVVCPWRYKFLAYLLLMTCGLFVMPGPTLMLMLLLSVPYFMFLSGSATPGSAVTRFIGAAALSLLLIVAAVVIGRSFFAERLNDLSSGKDASSFYRFTGPMLVALDIFKHHPWAGAGLTGEPFITNEVLNVYMNAPGFQSGWQIPRIGDVLTNYFWLHWIYLGLVWGSATVIGISLWLRKLGVPSVLYCWAVWVILGQASGSYVGPKTWAVLLIGAAAAVVSAPPQRQLARMTVSSTPTPQFHQVHA